MFTILSANYVILPHSWAPMLTILVFILEEALENLLGHN